MLGKGHCGLYKAPKMEGRRKGKAEVERNQIKLVDLRDATHASFFPDNNI